VRVVHSHHLKTCKKGTRCEEGWRGGAGHVPDDKRTYLRGRNLHDASTTRQRNAEIATRTATTPRPRARPQTRRPRKPRRSP
jgi:hypothetical protein